MSRSLDELNPQTKAKALAFLAQCKAEGIDVLIYCTYRSDAEQAELYKIGRTVKGANPRPAKPMGDIVTNTEAGESEHNKRRAWDCVPMIGGKPQWNDKVRYARMGAIGEQLGLEWAGRWTGKLKETAHFQYKGN